MVSRGWYAAPVIDSQVHVSTCQFLQWPGSPEWIEAEPELHPQVLEACQHICLPPSSNEWRWYLQGKFCFTQSLLIPLRLHMQEDVLLRALRFMDNMLQRDAVQKSAFLKDLAGFCTQFDERVLRYQVPAGRLQASAQLSAACLTCLPVRSLLSVQSSCNTFQ